MKLGTLNVPASWERMSGHERANYLVNTHQVKNFAIGMASARKKTEAKPVPTKKKSQVYWWEKD